MSERGTKLLDRASGQISELIGLLSASGEAALLLPNPARQKLGDGTVGASASHTADSYHRIAEIVRASWSRQREQGGGEDDHLERSRSNHHYEVENMDLQGLLDRLSAGRISLSVLADLTDDQLDNVPPARSARFSDGKRTLEQVVSGALSHQGRNVDALKAAVA
jgi:hypothetical protein